MFQHLKKPFNYSSVHQQNIMRNKTRICCIPLLWVIKGIKIWDAQNDLYISSKIKISGLTKLLSKKVTEWRSNNFLNVIKWVTSSKI